MRISTHGLSEQYVYPCSKSGVKAAFGEQLLEGASFGLSPSFTFEARVSPQPKILGRVIMALSFRAPDEASLYIYRVPIGDLDYEIRKSVEGLMRGPMRQWLDAMLSRPETEVFGADQLLVELREGQLLLHQTLFR